MASDKTPLNHQVSSVLPGSKSLADGQVKKFFTILIDCVIDGVVQPKFLRNTVAQTDPCCRSPVIHRNRIQSVATAINTGKRYVAKAFRKASSILTLRRCRPVFHVVQAAKATKAIGKADPASVKKRRGII